MAGRERVQTRVGASKQERLIQLMNDRGWDEAEAIRWCIEQGLHKHERQSRILASWLLSVAVMATTWAVWITGIVVFLKQPYGDWAAWSIVFAFFVDAVWLLRYAIRNPSIIPYLKHRHT